MQTYLRNTIDAVIFDLDGTLLDSEQSWQQVVKDYLNQHDRIYNPSTQRALLGLAMDDTTRGLKTAYNLPDDVETIKRDLLVRADARLTTPFAVKPGVEELLAYLANLGIPIAIASNSPFHSVQAKLSHHEWSKLFTVRCSVDHVVQGKPAPDLYRYAAAQLGVAPERCLAVEDSPTGVQAAVAAGMTCYAVPDAAHHRPAEFAALTPYIFSDLYGVLNAIQRIDTIPGMDTIQPWAVLDYPIAAG